MELKVFTASLPARPAAVAWIVLSPSAAIETSAEEVKGVVVDYAQVRIWEVPSRHFRAAELIPETSADKPTGGRSSVSKSI